VGHPSAPTNEAVIWLGRALGRAARRSADLARTPRSIFRHLVSSRSSAPEPEGAHRADARLLGGRIAWDPDATSAETHHRADVSDALSDPDPVARVRALRALGHLSKQRAEHLVAPMLHDPHPAVRRAAAETAAELGATSSVFSLILGLEDGDEGVRDACQRAFHEITGKTPWRGPLAAGERHQRAAELRAWWKAERVERLLGRARDEPLTR
jgi:hypothetical protein